MEEMADIKTAVSEAVTNAIIHGYENWYGYGKHGDKVPAYVMVHPGKIYMHCKIEDTMLYIEIQDKGKGIEDVEKAMEPLYTTRPEFNRSGMGFAFMEAFMDEVQVYSVVGEGTRVVMEKTLGKDCE
jgi:stage II sporulation protein AB (anti-sigma F factor)